VSDAGLAAERTELSRRRTVVPFLVVAALAGRAALEDPLPGLALLALACAGALVVGRAAPTLLTTVVLALAMVAALLPG
jgi:hypothetical protein